MSYLDESVLKAFFDNIGSLYYENTAIPTYTKDYGKICTYDSYDNILKDGKFLKYECKTNECPPVAYKYFIHMMVHIKSCKFYKSFNFPLIAKYLYDEGTHIVSVGIDNCGNLYEIISVNGKLETVLFSTMCSERKLPDIVIDLIKSLEYNIKEDFQLWGILNQHRNTLLKYYPTPYRVNDSNNSSLVVKLSELFVKIQELEESYYKQHASIKRLAYTSLTADYRPDVSEVPDEIKKLKSEIVGLNDVILTLTTSNMHEKQDLQNALHKEISQLKQELALSCTKYESMQNEIIKLNGRNQSLSQNLQVTSIELEKSNKLIFDLKTKIRELIDNNDLKQAYKSLMQFKHEAEKYYGEILRLKAENEQFTRNLDELVLEGCEKREESLKQKIYVLERENAKLKADVRERDSTIVNLTAQTYTNSEPPPYSA